MLRLEEGRLSRFEAKTEVKRRMCVQVGGNGQGDIIIVRKGLL